MSRKNVSLLFLALCAFSASVDAAGGQGPAAPAAAKPAPPLPPKPKGGLPPLPSPVATPQLKTPKAPPPVAPPIAQSPAFRAFSSASQAAAPQLAARPATVTTVGTPVSPASTVGNIARTPVSTNALAASVSGAGSTVASRAAMPASLAKPVTTPVPASAAVQPTTSVPAQALPKVGQPSSSSVATVAPTGVISPEDKAALKGFVAMDKSILESSKKSKEIFDKQVEKKSAESIVKQEKGLFGKLGEWLGRTTGYYDYKAKKAMEESQIAKKDKFEQASIGGKIQSTVGATQYSPGYQDARKKEKAATENLMRYTALAKGGSEQERIKAAEDAVVKAKGWYADKMDPLAQAKEAKEKQKYDEAMKTSQEAKKAKSQVKYDLEAARLTGVDQKTIAVKEKEKQEKDKLEKQATERLKQIAVKQAQAKMTLSEEQKTSVATAAEKEAKDWFRKGDGGIRSGGSRLYDELKAGKTFSDIGVLRESGNIAQKKSISRFEKEQKAQSVASSQASTGARSPLDPKEHFPTSSGSSDNKYGVINPEAPLHEQRWGLVSKTGASASSKPDPGEPLSKMPEKNATFQQQASTPHVKSGSSDNIYGVINPNAPRNEQLLGPLPETGASASSNPASAVGSGTTTPVARNVTGVSSAEAQSYTSRGYKETPSVQPAPAVVAPAPAPTKPAALSSEQPTTVVSSPTVVAPAGPTMVNFRGQLVPLQG